MQFFFFLLLKLSYRHRCAECRKGFSTMDQVSLNTMNSASKMMNSAFKMMTSVLQTMTFVSVRTAHGGALP